MIRYALSPDRSRKYRSALSQAQRPGRAGFTVTAQANSSRSGPRHPSQYHPATENTPRRPPRAARLNIKASRLYTLRSVTGVECGLRGRRRVSRANITPNSIGKYRVHARQPLTQAVILSNFAVGAARRLNATPHTFCITNVTLPVSVRSESVSAERTPRADSVRQSSAERPASRISRYREQPCRTAAGRSLPTNGTGWVALSRLISRSYARTTSLDQSWPPPPLAGEAPPHRSVSHGHLLVTT